MAEYTFVADRTGELRLSAEAKAERYRTVRAQVEATIEGEADLLACMTSVVCLLHNAFPYYFWTGFYRRVSADELLVGPYQGTLGCLRIRFGRGVCGACAAERRTVVIPDVHAFPGHIACDAASASEIVVPVLDARGGADRGAGRGQHDPRRLRRHGPGAAGGDRRPARRPRAAPGGGDGVAGTERAPAGRPRDPGPAPAGGGGTTNVERRGPWGTRASTR